jgi:hypothetical protein
MCLTCHSSSNKKHCWTKKFECRPNNCFYNTVNSRFQSTISIRSLLNVEQSFLSMMLHIVLISIYSLWHVNTMNSMIYAINHHRRTLSNDSIRSRTMLNLSTHVRFRKEKAIQQTQVELEYRSRT